MLPRHGWKSSPSPRRGFTFVEATRGISASPVVVAVHDSTVAMRLFRSALDEAISRSRDLIVLDYGERSLHDELEDEESEVDERERHTMRVLWSNPHVHVIRIEPPESDLEKTVSYCETVRACLLVLGADHVASAGTVDLSERIFGGSFDLLILTDSPTRDRSENGTRRRSS